MYSFQNGKYLKQAKISIQDRGFLYGDGVFESLRTYRGDPFLLKEHLSRLGAGCKLLKIKIKVSPGRIKKIIAKLLKINNLQDGYIKIFVTRGEAKGHGLSIKKSKGKPTFIITAEKINPPPKSIRTIIYRRPRCDWAGVKMKTLNYLEHIFARMEAQARGADEAIFTDAKGRVLEGTTCNIFIVKNDTLITSPKTMPILPGVTRNHVIKLARKIKIRVAERSFKSKEFYSADECFLTSSGMGIVPVNGKSGKITKKLMEVYNAKI